MKRHPSDAIEREFRLHIDLVTDELVSDGWDEDAARREAQRRFGHSTRLARQCRAAQNDYDRGIRSTAFAESVVTDLRQAFRSFRRAPGFAATVVATLALGIGATTTVFSVVDTLVLRPLPYPDPDRLVQVGTLYPGRDVPSSSSPLNFFDWRDRSEAFERLIASRMEAHTVVTDGFPEQVTGAGVSAGYFELLGASPMLGRAILPADDRPGAPRVTVLRHRAWRSRWGGDAAVVGQTVSLSGEPFTVVGVMPADFHPPEALYHGEADFWIPLAHVGDDLQQRDNAFLQVIGRLRPDVTASTAAASLTALQQRIYESLPPADERLTRFRAGLGVGVVSLMDQTVGDQGRLMFVFLGAVGLLLAIACANAANLVLARSADRSRELALRATLGARGGRILRQLLTESVVLATVAGAAGVVLAMGGVRAFLVLAPQDLPRLAEVTVDLRILAFAAALSVLTGIVFGIAPAARHAGGQAWHRLQETTSSVTSSRTRHRLRRTLVAIEVAVAAVLLIGAGLLANSFVRLVTVDPGFDPNGLAHMALYIGDEYESDESQAAFFRDLVERLQNAPGIVSAAATSNLPMTNNRSTSGVTAEGVEGTNTTVSVNRITSRYFETLRVPLLAGRDFSSGDRAGEPVAIVTQTFADEFWPGESVLGRRFKFGEADSPAAWLTIVGVAGDIHQHGLGRTSGPTVYLYHERSPFVFGNIVVRGTSDPALLVSMLRGELRTLDPRQAVDGIGPLTDRMSATVTRPRFNAMLLGSFGIVALVIASVGVYGAVSYIVRQRTQEVGIRLALGATGPRVIGLVMRQGLGSVLVGALIGTVASVPLSRVLDALVYGIGTTDLPTYATVTTILVAVAALGCWIPARRAVRVDPATTLRAE